MIGEPLALAATYRRDGPIRIIVAKRHAVIVTKIELREIAVQVLFLAVLINAPHAALKDREKAFR